MQSIWDRLFHKVVNQKRKEASGKAKVTELINGVIEIWIQIIWLQIFSIHCVASPKYDCNSDNYGGNSSKDSLSGAQITQITDWRFLVALQIKTWPECHWRKTILTTTITMKTTLLKMPLTRGGSLCPLFLQSVI